MPVERPSRDDLARLAADAELAVDDSDLDIYHDTMSGLMGSWDAVEELYAEVAPPAPERDWHWPTAGENELGAWYVRTEITGASDGPLAGYRVAVKDNTSVAGVPLTNGSRTVEGFIPTEDATVVTRLLAAGATIAGKATCEDLCFSGASHTSKPHQVHNPWSLAHSAGGSSSGSAALVAAGEVDVAVGGDQGGSVRGPAANCGIVGHKPTFGLVPYTGAFPIEQSIDHLGPMTRTVADAARMLTVMAGTDGLDPRQPSTLENIDYHAELKHSVAGLRIGVLREGFALDNMDPRVAELVRDDIARLEDAGMSWEETSVPWHLHAPAIWDVISVEGGYWQMILGNAYGRNWKGHYDPELIEHFGRQWRRDPAQFSPTVKLVAMAGEHVLSKEQGRHYAMARRLETMLTQAYDAVLEDHDVLIMPTGPHLPAVLPAPDAPVSEVLGVALTMLGNTLPFNLTGHPACSVPAGVIDGLPVGMMIVGKHFDDATVLRVGHAFENTVKGFPLPQTAGHAS